MRRLRLMEMASRTRAEILIAKALRDASIAALERYLLVGDAKPPEYAAQAFARVLGGVWWRSVKSGARETRRQIGLLDLKADDLDLWQLFVEEYIQTWGAQAIANIMETTRLQIIDAVAVGLRDGKSIATIAVELREAIPALSRRRAAIIARTETHSAAQFASIQTAKRAPFPLVKTWNSAYDHRTRDFGEADGKVDQANHRKMNGVSVALDEPFQVPNKWGGFDPMQFPGDQSAPAYTTVNCRCALTYRRAARMIAP